MPMFKVWRHDDRETIEDYVDVQAADFESAAESCANDDTDGQTEGIYDDGFDFGVEDEHGDRRLVTVTVEWERVPSFFAWEKPWK